MTTPYFAIARWGLPPSQQQPITGHWYTGVNAKGETGMLAAWDGDTFKNSVNDDNNEAMAKYDHLREQQHDPYQKQLTF